MSRMKLLIAYDGSECARLALDDLRKAGLPSDVQATVVSIADMICLPTRAGGADHEFPEWMADSIERAQDEREEAVERMNAESLLAAERLRAEFPGWLVEAEAFGDSPAWGILKRADQLRPDLIVLGSHGYSALGRLFLGSVSLKVLHAASCSVRITRVPQRAPSPLRLLLGVDGSRHSLAAARAIESRSWPSGTKVRVVSAVDAVMATAIVLPSVEIQRWVEATPENDSWVQRMTTAVARQLREAALDVEALVVQGEPKHVLVEEAKRWKADCVFVGSQGLNAVERLMLGSVSSAVAARAPCSVEVVRLARADD